MSNGNALPLKDRLVVSGIPTPHRILRADEEQQSATKLNKHESSPPHLNASRSLRETCADIHERVRRFLFAPPPDPVTRSTQEQTRVAISVITKALQDYDFDGLSLSYNGGKDCLVLLILYLSVLHTHFTQPSGRRKRQGEDDGNGNDVGSGGGGGTAVEAFPTSIPSIYAKPPDPFDAVSTFVDASTRDYHLDLVHISTNPGPSPKSKSHSSPPLTRADLSNATTGTLPAAAITNGDIHHNDNPVGAEGASTTTSGPPKPIISFRDAFAMYLTAHPGIRAIFVGTRRTDPHGATLQHFQMTDGNWPRFMRVHPVIDWHLSQIWCFLRSDQLADPRTAKKLDYCDMYDAGYTSLGGVGDTVRNPKLRYVDDRGEVRYRPAYEMTEDEEERAGRE